MSMIRTAAIGVAALAAATLSTSAFADSGGAIVATSPAVVQSAGVIASAKQLAASPANQAALKAAQSRHVEKPVHRLPNGGLTSQPSAEALSHLHKTAKGGEVGKLGLGHSSAKGAVTSSFVASYLANFVGATTGSNLTDGASELEPPDQGLGVNSNTVVEVINNTFQVFNSGGAPLTGPIATDVFFNIGNNAHDYFSESDPQVFFDPFVGRWFVTELIWNPGTGFAGFAVAVSQTSNPLGGYFLYHVRAFGFGALGCFTSADASTCLPDYPKAGYNGDGFFITADMFSNFGSGGFVNAVTYALPIAKMIAGQPFSYNAWVLVNGNGAPTGDFVIQPSIPALGEGLITTNGGTEFMMEARNIIDGSHNVRVIAVWNTFNIGSGGVNIAWTDTNPGVAYGGSVPAGEPNAPGPLCKLVGFPAPKLDGGYDSFTANIIVANGNLWGILDFGALDSNGFARDILDLNVINPGFNPAASPPVQPFTVAAGTLAGGNGASAINPTLAMNSANQTGGISLTFVSTTASGAGSSNLFPSQLIVPFSYTLGPFSFTIANPENGRLGAAADDGFTGCGGSGVGRWGDYGQASVDTATGLFWFGNEMIPYATQSTDGQFTNWGTNVIGISVH